jgi:hypothetical protein
VKGIPLKIQFGSDYNTDKIKTQLKDFSRTPFIRPGRLPVICNRIKNKGLREFRQNEFRPSFKEKLDTLWHSRDEITYNNGMRVNHRRGAKS